jgi:hypothetical protein
VVISEIYTASHNASEDLVYEPVLMLALHSRGSAARESSWITLLLVTLHASEQGETKRHADGAPVVKRS